MAALTNTQISVTYVGLLKTSANTVLSSTGQQITDGEGNNSILFLSTAGVGIGGAASSGKELDVTGNVLVTGDLQVDNINIDGNTISATSGVVTLANGAIATTQSQNDNSTKIATTAYVDAAIDGIDTLAEILAIGNTTGGTDIAVSANDDITFTSSSKAIFGPSTDLQIYSDASNNYIDSTSNELRIRSNDLRLLNFGSAKYITADNGADVSLYHNDSKKLETTSTGAKVTGSNLNVFAASGATKLEFGQTNGNWKIEAGNSGNNTLIIGSVSNATNNITLDTTNGGSATFSGNVSLTSGALSITADGSNAVTFTESGAGLMTIAAPDDIVLDSGSDIILDAGGDDIRLKVNGTEYAKFDNASSNLNITSSIQDKDIKFHGNDGGSAITALTLDMSEGGNATFASNVGIGVVPNAKLEISDATNDNLRIGTRGGNINIFSVNDAGATAPLRLEASDFQFINGDATFAGDVGLGGTGLYTSSHSLNIDGTGLAIKNSINGGSNNWSHITNTDTGGASNFVFTTGGGIALTLAQNKDATFAGDVTLEGGRVIVRESDDGNDAAKLTRDADEGYLQLFSSGTQTIEIRGNGNSYFNGGNIGIGTTAAASGSHKLVVESASTTGTVNSHIALIGDSATDGQGPQILFSESGDGQAFAGGTIGFTRTGGNSQGDLVFGTRGTSGDATTTTTERMRITSGGATTFAGELTANGDLLQVSGAHPELKLNDSDDSNHSLVSYSDGDLLISTNHGNEAGAADTIRFANNGATERMRITSSGDIGIGSTSPSSYNSRGQDLVIKKTGSDVGISIVAEASGGTDYSSSILFADGTGGTAGYRGIIEYDHASDYMAIGTAATERMRITSSGELIVGKTSFTADSLRIDGNGIISTERSGTSASTHHNFFNGNGLVGTIQTSGTATVYNTSSDYRLKEDLQDFAGLDMVSKIPVYDFKWKTDESRSYGVMAHELEEVLPQAVTGEKDAEEMQSVDYSKIVPLLVKSIQELKKEIEILKSK